MFGFSFGNPNHNFGKSYSLVVFANIVVLGLQTGNQTCSKSIPLLDREAIDKH